MKNILTVDLEDYFHPSEVQPAIAGRPWESFPSRIEANTRRVLRLLNRYDAPATFFVLGWVAARYPQLIRDIRSQGHEIGCHSYWHRLVYQMNPSEFRADTRAAMAAIEDACGVRPRLYRAPSYSLISSSLWALDVLAELGFTHDSSIYPIVHDRYGIPGFPRHPHIVETGSGPILEVPVATVRLVGDRVAPVGGGGYMRLLPYRYTSAGVRRLNETEGQPACLYLHPWELDSEQPRLATSVLSRTRTYFGLSSVEQKLKNLLTEFTFSTMTAVHPAPSYIIAEKSLSACSS